MKKCKYCGVAYSDNVLVIHQRICKEKNKEIDIEQYHSGYGWYEYEGSKYRREDLLKKLGD